METPGDAALVERARSGDRAAFARLVERHFALLTGVCRRAVGPLHFVLGLLDEGRCVAVGVLRHLGVGLDRMRGTAEQLFGRGESDR